jgi:hypothetical protein
MATREPSALRRFLFWDYPRASWQYDLIVALILGFIFLTPREVFHDQPKAASIVMLPSEQSSIVYWIEPDLLESLPEAGRAERVANLIKDRSGKKHQVSRVEPIFGEEHELKGYMAFTKP